MHYNNLGPVHGAHTTADSCWIQYLISVKSFAPLLDPYWIFVGSRFVTPPLLGLDPPMSPHTPLKRLPPAVAPAELQALATRLLGLEEQAQGVPDISYISCKYVGWTHASHTQGVIYSSGVECAQQAESSNPGGATLRCDEAKVIA